MIAPERKATSWQTQLKKLKETYLEPVQGAGFRLLGVARAVQAIKNAIVGEEIRGVTQ
jgi:hypothetical protein